MLRLRIPEQDDEIIWSLVEAELIPKSNLNWDIPQLKNEMPKRLSKGFTYVKVDLVNQPIAFIHAVVIERILFIDMLAVHSYLQRRGIGQILLQSAEKQAILQSCSSSKLAVDAGNEPARRFYERAGYKSRQYLVNLQCWEMFKPFSQISE
ncbi:GNAT family N-acetyltransferase [Paenibacillus sp. SC116]|uniref:GNAT family N-acetyltransferase n=1 Tax=Paenibacillus sp. SC116 TaxID=2968986 RepID=UPI00215AFD39|nr:GNAT family N-acetyltransferase [Paenibacillus sp. SC116]MCR8843855.1 GNAT family N-acetyltransferase [Paenibacillus sp. SC116]